MKYLFFGISILYLGVAVWVFPDEYDAFEVSGDEPIDWYLARDSIELPQPRSVESYYLVMQACDRSVISIVGSAVPRQTSESIWRMCLNQSEAVLEAVPDLGVARLVRASALAKLGRIEDSYEALLAVEEVAPNLAWMAMRRFDIATQIDGVNSDEVRALMQRDVVRSASDRESADLLARRFSAHPGLRDFIIDALADQPPEYQRHLLFAYNGLRG
ncbi:MAG: hypothetical protein AAF092_08675 [Pseudomonadota bacterium]